MADGLRSRDTRCNSGKCYTMFFDTEIMERRKPKVSPKKRESPRKRALILESYSAAKILKAAEENPKHVHFQKSESTESEEEHGKRKLSLQETDAELKQEVDAKKPKINTEKDQMFEIFQPWALKTYGDQAKTKTITLKKKARILKALDGKEQNNPDSSKFRFWVKSKGFTIKIPENFTNHELNQKPSTQRDEVDLYVASTTKDFGERTYKRVAVVEEFFRIIYNIHVEQGGRNSRHAGQKRTYRIITETYAFLPREAVTKFLSGCPACKKNLRPFSPSRFDEQFTESSSEFEALNYSSQNESSVDSSQHEMAQSLDKTKTTFTKCQDLLLHSNISNQAMPNFSNKIDLNTKQCEIAKVNCKTGEIRKGDDFKFHNYWNICRPDVSNEHILNYYQFLKRFYSNSSINGVTFPISDSSLNNKVLDQNFPQFQANSVTNQNISHVPTTAFDESPPFIRDNCSNSTIDLTIKPSDSLNQSININIENPLLPDNLRTKCNTSISPCSNPNMFINSVDVSINVSKTVNQLNITCKTTPPKKRYNVYCHNVSTEKVDSNCAINLSKIFCETQIKSDIKKEIKEEENDTRMDPTSFKLDLNSVKPITSTYLKMTRSLGLSDEDALKIDDLESLPTSGNETISDQATEDSYAGLMKDADKLKLMLLAWNYQNSSAARNSTDAPDLGVVGGLWAQYQNALALNTKQSSLSPVHRTEQSSPIENQDETNSSGQKDEDDGSEDDSDDKLDQNAQDPERLKAFNMFVRLFVDENLDRMIPISKQPKEKIQAIIDSCARQFPEFCERSRKRIRTYLKSCRRNKKAREGWDNTSRPTPAHLTSVQAEQILAIACENESMNAKRMRVGLDPISQAMPLPSGVPNAIETIAPSVPYPTFRTTPNTTASSTEPDQATPATTVQSVNPARSSPLSLNTTGNEAKSLTVASSITTNSQISNSPLYRPADFASPSSTSSPYAPRPQTYPSFFPTSTSAIATPTDLSMKQHQPQSTQQLPSAGVSPTPRPPIVTHKLSANEITAARQVITAYRESAAFLLRTADQVEQLLLQQQ